MKRFTPEMIEKAKTAQTAEELLTMAKEADLTMTADEAAAYFSKLNLQNGELADTELDNVAGGGCSGDDTPAPTPLFVAGERVMLDELLWVLDNGGFGTSASGQMPGAVVAYVGMSTSGVFVYDVQYDNYSSRLFRLNEFQIHKL